MKQYPKNVKIVEVGPRDGLQNESKIISTSDKVKFIELLSQSGLKEIEVTSFVHPERVPQLADGDDVVKALKPHPAIRYSALVPNLRGLERAIKSGIKRIAVFTAASEIFTKKNINMTIDESLQTFKPVVQEALKNKISVRGYVSTCFVCPYEGKIGKENVLSVASSLLELGVDEISLGDTTGAAVFLDVKETVNYVLSKIPKEKIALHFHDTYGNALANVKAGLELGITVYDSSSGGLGGCPYAPGASGNLATEDLLYMLNEMEIEAGVKIDKIAEASKFIQNIIGKRLPSKQLQKILSSAK
ncbi:MAG: hydroxymethylglutaryl-CoA lyase [Candidatus Melainabacteria bacterium RIFCSPHIGHO2_02_FULL_34_12]|nr:MAG: hydroxymethylglutaryl-CoA lyase [Candidatus Melainabacteria bacterium RIFCSPHIGHO2_02_FULL_34_12]